MNKKKTKYQTKHKTKLYKYSGGKRYVYLATSHDPLKIADYIIYSHGQYTSFRTWKDDDGIHIYGYPVPANKEFKYLTVYDAMGILPGENFLAQRLWRCTLWQMREIYQALRPGVAIPDKRRIDGYYSAIVYGYRDCTCPEDKAIYLHNLELAITSTAEDRQDTYRLDNTSNDKRFNKSRGLE